MNLCGIYVRFFCVCVVFFQSSHVTLVARGTLPENLTPGEVMQKVIFSLRQLTPVLPRCLPAMVVFERAVERDGAGRGVCMLDLAPTALDAAAVAVLW